MSDERLRELERRWTESGSVNDEAAYLKQRVRAGDLSQERLDLAAYCGREAALVALGANSTVEWDSKAWAEGLGRWGPSIVLRAQCLLAEVLLPVWNENVPGDGRPEAALRAAIAHLEGTSHLSSDELLAIARSASDAFGMAQLPLAQKLAGRVCAVAAQTAGMLAGKRDAEDKWREWQAGMLAVLLLLARSSGGPGGTRAQAEVGRRLAAWALQGGADWGPGQAGW